MASRTQIEIPLPIQQAARDAAAGIITPESEQADTSYDYSTAFTSNYSYVPANVDFRFDGRRKKIITVEVANLAMQMFAEEVIAATMATPFSVFLAKLKNKAVGAVIEPLAKSVVELLPEEIIGAGFVAGKIAGFIAIMLGLLLSEFEESLVEAKIRNLGAKYRRAIFDARLISATNEKPVGRVKMRVRFK
jgi:hypothetical protein